jgi:RNA polymerase sigma-70 factor (ECF subfamily)
LAALSLLVFWNFSSIPQFLLYGKAAPLPRTELAAFTNEELLQHWFEGDADAFDEFYKRHAPRISAYARRKGLENSADDVTQDVFLRLHKNIDRYDSSRPALPWLFTFVHHACIDALRQKQRLTKKNTAFEAHAKASSQEENSLREQSIESFMKSHQGPLSQVQKEVVMMRVENNFSFREISSRTGKSEPALRKTYERAIATLRDWIKGGTHD